MLIPGVLILLFHHTLYKRYHPWTGLSVTLTHWWLLNLNLLRFRSTETSDPKEEKTPKEPLNQYAPDWTHHFRKVGTLLQWVSSLFIPPAMPETSITLLVSYPSCLICDNALLVLFFSIFSIYLLSSILTAAVLSTFSSLLRHIVMTPQLVSPVLLPSLLPPFNILLPE